MHLRRCSSQMREYSTSQLMILAGSSHQELAQAIVQRLGMSIGKVTLGKFSNQETSVQILESVRDMDVFILQSACGHINDMLVELLILVNACKTASAAKVTAVIPCFFYSRQPDAPYKKDGSPKKVTNVDSPSFRQQQKQMEEKQMNKIKALRSADEADGKSLHSPSSSASVSPEPKPMAAHEGPTVGVAVDQAIRRLQVTALKGSDLNSKTTMISSPMVSKPSSLGLVKSGYRHWVARSGTLIANMLMAAGVDAVITMDLHDPQYQGFFDIPVDNLHGSPLMVKCIRECIPDYTKAVIVSPDAGGAKKASAIANILNMNFALVHKEHKNHINHATALPTDTPRTVLGELQPSPSSAAENNKLVLVGKVRGKACVLIDDMADTANTITRAADLLVEKGATKVYGLITHGILSGDAVDRVQASRIDELLVSNTVPLSEAARKCHKIKVFDVSALFAEAIRRIHNGESVSALFHATD